MRKGYVSPELAQVILDRADNKCEVCEIYKSSDFTKRHEIHHILGRKVDATPDNLIYLCYSCHYLKCEKHRNSGLALKLKINLQDLYFSQDYSEEEVRALMGGKLEFDEFSFENKD